MYQNYMWLYAMFFFCVHNYEWNWLIMTFERVPFFSIIYIRKSVNFHKYNWNSIRIFDTNLRILKYFFGDFLIIFLASIHYKSTYVETCSIQESSNLLYRTKEINREGVQLHVNRSELRILRTKITSQ